MMNVALWKARFSDHLELRRFSPRTIEGYLAELEPFFAFLQGRGLEGLPEVNREVVEAYRDHLFHAVRDGRRLTPSTQSGRLSAVKAFTRFLHREHFLLIDPGAGVELPRVPRTLPRVLLDEDEAARVVEAPDVSTALGLRNRAILELLYGSALRAAELCALNVDDVVPGRREVRVRCGKGSKSRVVPLGDEAAAWVLAYVEDARPSLVKDASEPLLFVTYRGDRMLRLYLSRLVREAARLAGIDKIVTPHLLRHPHAAPRRRPAPPSGAAGTRLAGDHPAIHPHRAVGSAAGARQLPPAREGEIVMNLAELVSVYMRLQRSQALSLSTLGIERRWLEQFAAFCRDAGVAAAADVKAAHVAAYRRGLLWEPGPRGHLYRPLTVDQALRTVRSFFRWATKRGYLLVDPTADLVLSRPPKPVHTKILSVEEVELVLDTPDSDTPLGMRDRAVLETFYGTGVRLAECNDLDVADLDLAGRIVRVRRGKGGKARHLPLGETLVEALERYLTEARPTLVRRPDEPALFVSFLGCRLGLQSLQDVVVRCSRRALGFRIGQHALRHACATHLLQNGADLSSISELLGHSDPRSIYLYTHLCPQELFDEHRRTHPRAGRGGNEEAIADDDARGEDADDAPSSP